MSCNRCAIHGASNEAPEDAFVHIEPAEPYGFNVFIAPPGQPLDTHERSDNTVSPQRVLWTCDFPDKCTCDQKVKLAPRSTVKPLAASKPKPESPKREREFGEAMELL